MRLALALAAFLYASPAGAGVDASLTQTVGSANYRGTRLWVDVGEDLHFRPSVSTYRSDSSGGRFATYSLRGSFDAEAWSAGAVIGGTPRVEGYASGFFGVDGSRMIGPEERPVDLGLGLTVTNHSDEFTAGRRRRTHVLRVQERALSMDAALLLERADLSAGLTHSFYDRDLDALADRAAQATRLQGVQSVGQGYPIDSVNLRCDGRFFDRALKPYVSFTHTTYSIGQPPSNTWTFGATVKRGRWEPTASLEFYNVAGASATQGYFSLGLTARF